ncbi:hypothetical protein ACFLVN_00065 [Chloroflexota bacterium]
MGTTSTAYEGKILRVDLTSKRITELPDHWPGAGWAARVLSPWSPEVA